MKKHFIILLFLLMVAMGATAQKSQCSLVGVNKQMRGADAVYGALAGNYKGMDYFAVNDYNAFGNGPIMLIGVNNLFKTQKKLILEDTRRFSVEHATIVDGKSYLLLHDQTDSKKEVLYRVAVNLSNMKEESRQEVLHNVMNRKDNTYMWVEQSPDCQYTGVVSIVSEAKGNVRLAEVMLLDNQFNTVWHKQIDIRSMSQLKVTNDGILITFGSSFEQDHTIFNIAAIDETNEMFYNPSIPLDGQPTKSAMLLSEVNGNLMIGGLTTAKENSDDATGCFVACYNFIDEEMHGSTLYPFDKYDFAVLNNDVVKTKIKRRKITTANYVTLTNAIATNSGAAFVLQTRYYNQVSTSNGGTSIYYIQKGSLLFDADTTGNIVWHRNVRTEKICSNYPIFENNFLASQNGNVYFLQNEINKTPRDYQPNEKAIKIKYPTLFKNNLLALYKIDEEGNVSKQVFEKKNTNLLLSSYPNEDGSYKIFIGSLGTVSLINLKLY